MNSENPPKKIDIVISATALSAVARCRWCGAEVFVPGGRDMCADCGLEVEQAMADRARG